MEETIGSRWKMLAKERFPGIRLYRQTQATFPDKTRGQPNWMIIMIIEEHDWNQSHIWGGKCVRKSNNSFLHPRKFGAVGHTNFVNHQRVDTICSQSVSRSLTERKGDLPHSTFTPQSSFGKIWFPSESLSWTTYWIWDRVKPWRFLHSDIRKTHQTLDSTSTVLYGSVPQA